MRILITTGLSKNDVGGPAQYAGNLKAEFEKIGHKVMVAKYGSIERSIIALWRQIIWADFILALDTFSVGFPSVLWAKVFRKKIIVRVGGDFLWSVYVNRTRKSLTLPGFYENMPKLNAKERIIFALSKWAIRNASYLAFNTEWQRKIWRDFYKLSESKIGVVRNFIPESQAGVMSSRQNFLWAGRLIPEKNTEMLKRLGIEIVTGESHEKVLERIRNCYAVVSLAFTDVCPNFIIEGISSGKPFIMTKYTGLNELFPKSGIFVEPRNEEEVREAMRNLNKIQVEEIKSYSWGEMAQEYLDIWKKI